MVKGVSVKFSSYEKTIPALLKLIKLDEELKKHNKVILKPFLRDEESVFTKPEFTEEVLKFCIANKRPEGEIFIAEGSDYGDTLDLFEQRGYNHLAEKYAVGLIDLNDTEVQEIQDDEFIKLQGINYPKILTDSFVISLAPAAEDEELELIASLSSMLGAYPHQHYKGFFSGNKSKLRKHPIKYAIHDILKCKLPDLALIDVSEKGSILAGQPFEIDKQAARILGREWKAISYLKLFGESFPDVPKQVKQQPAAQQDVK